MADVAHWTKPQWVLQQMAQNYLLTAIGGAGLALLAGVLGSLLPAASGWTDTQRFAFVVSLAVVFFIVGITLTGIAQSMIPALRPRPDGASVAVALSEAHEWETDAELIDWISYHLFDRGYGIDKIQYPEGSRYRGVLVDPKDGSNRAIVAAETAQRERTLYIALSYQTTDDEIEAQQAMPPITVRDMIYDLRLELARTGFSADGITSGILDNFTIWTQFPIGPDLSMPEVLDGLRRIWRGGLIVSITFRKVTDRAAMQYLVEHDDPELPEWVTKYLED